MITLVLRHRFIFSPILLSSIGMPFTGFKHVFRLYSLVDEYLPEEKEKLLKLEPAESAKHFIKLFSKRYFPIELSAFGDPVEGLIHHIPIRWPGGMTYSDYEPTYHPIPHGQLLAEAICCCPFEGRDYRLAVIDHFKKLGGEGAPALIKLLPAKGFTLNELELILQDSPYPGLLMRCRWIFSNTGNCWIDNTRRVTDWNRQNVEELARDWPSCSAIKQQMTEFNTWAKSDFPERSAQVIKYITGKKIPKAVMESLR